MLRPSQIDELRTYIKEDEELTALGQDYPAIAAKINEEQEIPNPAPRGKTPKRFSIGDVFGVITPAEAKSLYMIPGFRDDVQRALMENNRAELQNLLMIAAADLSSESLANLSALLAQEEDDPNWPEMIPTESDAHYMGWGRITEHDVQAALT